MIEQSCPGVDIQKIQIEGSKDIAVENYNPWQKSWHACPLFQYLSRKFISSPPSPNSMLFIVMKLTLSIHPWQRDFIVRSQHCRREGGSLFVIVSKIACQGMFQLSDPGVPRTFVEDCSFPLPQCFWNLYRRFWIINEVNKPLIVQWFSIDGWSLNFTNARVPLAPQNPPQWRCRISFPLDKETWLGIISHSSARFTCKKITLLLLWIKSGLTNMYLNRDNWIGLEVDV